MRRRLALLGKALAGVAFAVAVAAPAHSFAADTPEPPRLCFLTTLPPALRDRAADDVKLLIGWGFDAALSGAALQPGDVIDRSSSITQVPGFSRPTPLAGLVGRYVLLRRPYDRGKGYYGIALGALDGESKVAAVILVNRLFRMPAILQQPVGLATDIATNGAMFFAVENRAIRDAEDAALAAYDEAATRGVPLIVGGQSQAGGTAQVQVAAVLKRRPRGQVPVGFISFNAFYALPLVEHLGFAGASLPGVNFSKDLDPGFGPKAALASRVGLQIYIHRDGSGGLAPGDVSYLTAFVHPQEHLLGSFDDVSVARALAPVLARPGGC